MTKVVKIEPIPQDKSTEIKNVNAAVLHPNGMLELRLQSNVQQYINPTFSHTVTITTKQTIEPVTGLTEQEIILGVKPKDKK
jgi:hypothetical protein